MFLAKLDKIVEAADEARKGKEPASSDDPVVLAQKELKELKEILPDIMSKVRGAFNVLLVTQLLIRSRSLLVYFSQLGINANFISATYSEDA